MNRDRTVVANFRRLPTFTISATKYGNGTIAPYGDVQVEQGSDATFTITPDIGFRIMSVEVDGIDIGVVGSYTFNDVNRDHTIFVSFAGWGIEDNNAVNINIYPNPAKETVFVEGDNLMEACLFDLLGKRLRTLDCTTGNEMSLTGLEHGIYILTATTRDGYTGYKKIVVSK